MYLNMYIYIYIILKLTVQAHFMIRRTIITSTLKYGRWRVNVDAGKEMTRWYKRSFFSGCSHSVAG